MRFELSGVWICGWDILEAGRRGAGELSLRPGGALSGAGVTGAVF